MLSNISPVKKALAIFVISTIIVIYIVALDDKKKLENNFKITSGEIQNVFVSSKNSNVLVRYIFEVNGKKISGTSNTGCSDYKYYYFLNKVLSTKSLTVVFEKNKPSNSEMLFSSKDFRRFKIEIPANEKYVVKIIDSLLFK